MLTLSNKPLRLIASVEMFDGDAMFELFVAADFFNNDCKSKILFNCDFKEAKIVPAFIRFSFTLRFADIKQTTFNNRNQFLLVSHFTFHVAIETFMT